MRFFLSLVLLLCLFWGHMGLFSPGQAVAATQKTTVAVPQSVSLQQIIKEFDSLCKDEKKGNRRDLWLTLEKKFATVEKASQRKTAASAALYYARARQEMGRRSHLSGDYQEAATRFASVASRFSTYPVAPTALYSRAEVLENRLANHAEAAITLQRLIKEYPKAAEAPSARKLLARVEKATTPQSKPPSGKAGTTTGSPVTLKNIRWQGTKQRGVVLLELENSSSHTYVYKFVPPDVTRKKPGHILLEITGAFPVKGLNDRLSPKNLVVSGIRVIRSNSSTRVLLECDDGARFFAVGSPKNAPQTIQIEVSHKDDIAGGTRMVARETATPASKESVMKQLGLTVQTIMLDPGHGGKDPGAMAGGIEEKQFTLSMAKRVGTLLRKKGFTVLYTRSGNQFVSLQARADIANSKKADLIVSIHVNANTSPSIRGIETYYLDKAKTQDAALVAARENGISTKNISDLQVILTDLLLSSKVQESRHLANCIHNGIIKRLKNGNVATHNNGVRSAPFYVLMGARMPAILVEFGYITNPQDAINLKSEKYLQRQAEGLVEGILHYKADLAAMAPR